MKPKMLAMSLGAALLIGGEAFANGKTIYYRGSEAAIGRPGTPIATVPAAPVQYAAPQAAVPALPAATTAAAPPAANPGCLNCTPGSAQARNYGAGTPNAIVTFLHPYTNKAVSIPMTLPVGTPTIVTRSDRIIYNYSKFGPFGQYITVRFYPDGTVSTYYH